MAKLDSIVSLVSSEGVKTEVALATLIHASPVFEKMFQGQFAEAKTLEVHLPDFKVKEIQSFVKLAEFGSHRVSSCLTTCTVARACALPAMLLVDKYQATGLKKVCREALKNMPSAEYIVKYEENFGQGCDWSRKELISLMESTLIVETTNIQDHRGEFMVTNERFVTNTNELLKLSGGTLVKIIQMANELPDVPRGLRQIKFPLYSTR